MKYGIVIGILSLCLGLGSCRTASIAGYYGYETECMGDNFDGSYMLRTQGQGSTRPAAIAAAKRNVINDLLFSGVKRGQCTLPPLLTELNAREKYRSYVERFFADGSYDAYASLSPRYRLRKVALKDKTMGSTFLLVLRVERAQLEQRLRDDKIIQ
ncbi:MAG: hypothetical protein LUI04_03675 [Porphyromonadaceae bacterium]|nr:hypothetical protein [Porphyromonadaceae bacterium]